MHKKIIIILTVLVLLILIVPIPKHLKDGGSVEYNAILYKVTKVHSLKNIKEDSKGKYEEGLIIQILGFEVYNNVK